MSSPAPRIRVFTEPTLRVCVPLAELAVGNLCSPSRIDNMARALGVEFVPPSATVAPGLDPRVTHGNIAGLTRLVMKHLPVLRVLALTSHRGNLDSPSAEWSFVAPRGHRDRRLARRGGAERSAEGRQVGAA